MTKATLKTADKPRINSAQRQQVELTTAGLKRFLKKERWIGKTNRYATRPAKRVARDYAHNTFRQRNLAQFVAASATLHANDAWSYLGRAIASLIAGDGHRALHLGYYAELRAAMALLAADGIGIFNARHVVITGKDCTAKLQTKLGTHEVAWLALQQWSQSETSGPLLAKIIQVEGLSLEEWFAPLGGSTKIAAQARAWFLQWGMDLRFAMKDRTSRNESSYRPDGIPETLALDPAQTLDFVRELWRILEPRGPSSFEQVDRYVLRRAIESHFRGTQGKEPSHSDPKFAALVNSLVDAQSFSEHISVLLKKFLLRQAAAQDSRVFELSAQKPGSAADPYSILSRAALLLRAASGSCRDMLAGAGLSTMALEFWWKQVGVDRGLWQPGSEPDDLTDLWADIRDFVADADTAEAPKSFGELAKALGPNVTVSSSCERVGLWSLCPD
jgi:hypothetical protein